MQFYQGFNLLQTEIRCVDTNTYYLISTAHRASSSIYGDMLKYFETLIFKRTIKPQTSNVIASYDAGTWIEHAIEHHQRIVSIISRREGRRKVKQINR